MGKDHVLNINLCVKLMITFVFTLIQRVKAGLFGKSSSASFMYRWFIYDAMEYWSAAIRPFGLCNFYNLVCSNYCGAMIISWKICLFGQHTVHGLSQKSLHKYTIVCACQVLVQWERLIFSHYLWNTWYHGFVVLSMATTKCTGVAKPWHTFGLLICLAESKALVVGKFFA